MAFARPKPDANSDDVCQRYTEFSDVIRARNKREDRYLNVRLKFYEHQKNICLNIIRKEQRQLERQRTSLVEQAKKVQLKKQKFPFPSWMPPRSKSEGQILQLLVATPEFIVTDWELSSNFIESEIISPNPTDNMLTTTDALRCHSAR